MSSTLTHDANEHIKEDAPYNRALLLRRLAERGTPLNEVEVDVEAPDPAP